MQVQTDLLSESKKSSATTWYPLSPVYHHRQLWSEYIPLQASQSAEVPTRLQPRHGTDKSHHYLHIMSVPCRYAARSCSRTMRISNPMRASSSLPKSVATTCPQQRRHNSTAAAANPKIAGIVDQISQLTLLETADLVANLKVRRRCWTS